MKKLTVLFLFVLGACVQAEIVIDDFSTTQVLSPGEDGFVIGDGIIGGERDISTSYSFGVNINSAIPGQLFCENTSSSHRWVNITYDGIDGSGATDYGGLGHQDLTDGGQYGGLLLTFTDINVSGGQVNVQLTQEGQDSASSGFALPTLPGDIFLPFSNFEINVPAKSDPANNDMPFDFTDVGYIRLYIALSSTGSCTIDSLTVVPEPATLILFALGSLMLRKRK